MRSGSSTALLLALAVPPLASSATAAAAAAARPPSAAFAPALRLPPAPRPARRSARSVSPPPPRPGVARTGTSAAAPRRRGTRKKSARGRTPEEASILVRDLIAAAAEAGPRAGPARAFQACVALARTARDFLPVRPGGLGLGLGPAAEPFSAPVALRKLFERLGATYVKLGQFVASSPTLFPREYVAEFQKCLDATEPLEWKVIRGVIEDEIGPLSGVFAHVDREPLASASIAQVHAAKLLTGEDVVIKVQKPGIDESLRADLSFVYVASRVLEFIQPDWERTSLSAIAGDVRRSMLEELDFEREAANVEEFRDFLVGEGLIGRAAAPRVYGDFTTKRVLTMERLRGSSMLDAEAISRITDGDPEAAIVTALNVWTRSVVSMPWFHADVHAGNLLVLDDGRVGFIDFGIVGRVGDRTFKAVNDMSTALAVGDYEGVARAMCDMGAADVHVDVAKFGEDIRRVVTNLSQVQPDVTVAAMGDGTVAGRVQFDESEVTRILLDIVDVTEDNGLRLPREFGLLVKQSLYFDRYLKILAPDLDVMGDVRVTGIGGVDGDRARIAPRTAGVDERAEVVVDV